MLFNKRYRIETIRKKNFDYSSPGYYFVTICTQNRQNFFGRIENEAIQLTKLGEIAELCIEEIPIHFPNVLVDKFVVMPNHVHILVLILPYNVVETQNDKIPNRHTGNAVETQNFASLQNNANVKTQPENFASLQNNANVKTQPENFASLQNNTNVKTQPENFVSLQNQTNTENSPRNFISPRCINNKINITPQHAWNANRFGPQSKNLASIIRGYKVGVTKFCKKINKNFSWQSRYYESIIKTELDLFNVRKYIDLNIKNWNVDKNYSS